MTTIKGTHSIKLNQNDDLLFEIEVHGIVVITCSHLDQAEKFYQLAYDREYCTGDYAMY